MLRWCLPTVRELGGRDNALFKIRRICSSVKFTAKSTEDFQGTDLRSSTVRTLLINDSTLCDPGSLTSGVDTSYSGDCPCAGPDTPRPTWQTLNQQSPGASPVHHSDHRIAPALISHFEHAQPDTQPNVADKGHRHATLYHCRKEEESVPDVLSPQSSAFRLKQFLNSTSNVSSRSLIYSPNVVRSLYISAKTRSQLGELRPEEITTLISFFGTLSLSKAARAMYVHPLAMHTDRRQDRSYWAFIAQVGRDKHRMFKRLNPSDHYWLMRAQLAELEALGPQQGEGPTTRLPKPLLGARFHYSRIIRSSPHPDIHLPFLKALVSLQRLDEVVDWVSQLLDQHSVLHPRLLEAVWPAILYRDLQSSSRKKLLDSLRTRLAQSYQADISHTAQDVAGSIILPLSDANAVLPRIHELAKLLVAAVFCKPGLPDPSSEQRRYMHRWASMAVQSVFTLHSPESVPIDSTWVKLVLLAMTSAPFDGASGWRLAYEGESYTFDWQAVCVLTVLENLLHGQHGRTFGQWGSGGEGAAHIREILEVLWVNWSSAHPQDTQLDLISAIIIASFLYVAGRVHDERLVHLCYPWFEALITNSKADSLASLSVRYVLAEYVIASVACGCDLSTQVDLVADKIADPQVRASVFEDVVTRLVQGHALLPHQADILFTRFDTTTSPDILANIGRTAARASNLELALLTIRKGTFNTPQKLGVLKPILQIFWESDNIPTQEPLIRSLCEFVDELAATRGLSLLHVRADLENALQVIAQTGHTSYAVSSVQAIADHRPTYFRQSFIRTFIQQLLRQKSFRRAMKLSLYLLRRGSLKTPSMWAYLLVGFVRGGASRLARLLIQNSMPMEGVTLPSSLTISHVVKFRHNRPPSHLTLKLPKLLAGAKRHDFEHAYISHLLIRAGRIRAAKALLQNLRARLPTPLRTRIVNDIIHGSSIHKSRRNSRQMKKTLAVLKTYINEQQFVPDRVTVNILLKALLRWRKEVDADAVRALFDHMISGGYPHGGKCANGSLPFGAGASFPKGMQLPEIKTPISFSRHVRPLYKMFIKAMYLRQDVHAARTVVGILKAVQAEAARQKEMRKEARKANCRKRRQ